MASKASDLVKAMKRKIDVSLLSDDDSPCVVNAFMPTGCLVLDAIMGKGLPVGRLTEMFGDPSSGKSLIAAQTVALAQQSGIICGYVDTETAVSIDMMKMLGVDVGNLIYYSPDTIEEVFEFFETVAELKDKKFPDTDMLLVWDSVAATSDEYEMTHEYGKATMASHARIISQSLRKFTRILSDQRICALFLNQTRQKIGVMFGDDTSTFGGKAIPFHSSVRVQLDLSSKIKSDKAKNGKKRILGMLTRATVVKNKMAKPFRSATFPIYFGEGIDDPAATWLYLKDADLLRQEGRSYILSLGDEDIELSRADWPDFYREEYAAIAELVLAYDPLAVVQHANPEEQPSTEDESGEE
jgi:recombination protein RecA